MDTEGPRLASAADADTVAGLLHDFNVEFETPTPRPEVLAERLREHLAGDSMAALLIEDPAVGIALVSFRPNVWFPGPVALLDELYIRPDRRNHGLGTAVLFAVCELARSRSAGAVEINVDSGDVDTRRFYERHGFRNREPDRDDQFLYYYREL